MRRSLWLQAAAAALALLVGLPQAAVNARQPEPRRIDLSDLRLDRLRAMAEAARTGLDYVPGEVLVRFRRGVSLAGRARALRGIRSRPSPAALQWMGDTARLRDPSEPDPTILARQLQLQPEVEWAEPVYLRRRSAIPTDPSYATLQWNFNAIGMPAAWDIQPEAGRGIVVAVVDTGVTTVDETLLLPTWNGFAAQLVPMHFAVNPDVDRARLLPGRDFVFFSAGEPVLDFDGHGTHVAMTIAQEANNGLSGTGLAYRATLLPLKACISYWELQIVRTAMGIPGFHPTDDQGFCPSDAIVEAIRYAADHGAKVINLSFGGPAASQAERDAIAYAISRGATVVVAAGNSFEDGNPVEYPAGFAPDFAGLISVGAVGRTLGRAWYSNTGPHVEVVAPGGDTRAEAAGTGRIWQSTLAPSAMQPGFVIFPRFDRYEDVGLQGTSMATPHVSGLAAMLVAQGITRPAHVELLVTRTARDLGPAGRDVEYGAGLIQPRAALFGLGIRR